VYECQKCSVRLTDTGVVGRVLRVLLLVGAMSMLGFAVRLFVPWTLELFAHPVEAGALWILVLLLFGMLGFGLFLCGRSLYRLFVSRFVETKGIEAGV
jgi:hypothetical protein